MATLVPASQPSSPPPTGFSGCIASNGHAASTAVSRNRAPPDTAPAASMNDGGMGDTYMLAGDAGPARGALRGDGTRGEPASGGSISADAGAKCGEVASRRGEQPGPSSLGIVCTPMPPLSCVGGGPRRPSR
eukprot:scaffold39681_cov61-Phaeocystis_antarctica.AAC.4